MCKRFLIHRLLLGSSDLHKPDPLYIDDGSNIERHMAIYTKIYNVAIIYSVEKHISIGKSEVCLEVANNACKLTDQLAAYYFVSTLKTKYFRLVLILCFPSLQCIYYDCISLSNVQYCANITYNASTSMFY